jgi:outer membrane protein OmpA-like peptidoglycan-associated protein
LALSPRTLLAVAILIAGIAYTLPTQVAGIASFQPTTAGSVEPTFRITAWRGSLTVAGHTRSARHEALLRELAAQHYPDHERTFEFRPLGLVPDWWTDATTGLLGVMSPAISPSARLTADTLKIAAILPADIGTESPFGALEPLLPSTMSVQPRTAPAGPALSERELCERQFRRFRAGPVNFAGAGTTLRPSAYPELDRIVMLADACRGATLTITGHTDATGSESWNRQLSLDRARAVAAYLTGRGIAADDIVAAGAGSAVAVADNQTRYGRSLNRRIEVSFSYDPVSSGDVRLTSSISNSSVALGGTGGLPRAP